MRFSLSIMMHWYDNDALLESRYNLEPFQSSQISFDRNSSGRESFVSVQSHDSHLPNYLRSLSTLFNPSTAFDVQFLLAALFRFQTSTTSIVPHWQSRLEHLSLISFRNHSLSLESSFCFSQFPQNPNDYHSASVGLLSNVDRYRSTYHRINSMHTHTLFKLDGL